MVLNKSELIGSLQNEVRILLHLATKIDRAKLGYRPTAKQRSTLELLQYLAMMGPTAVEMIKVGKFDPPAWMAAEKAFQAKDFDQTIAAIAAHKEMYPAMLSNMTEADLRADVSMFGQTQARGAVLVRIVLAGCAAYRTQLFCYLKACGRDELSTMNLWGGMDAPAA